MIRNINIPGAQTSEVGTKLVSPCLGFGYVSIGADHSGRPVCLLRHWDREAWMSVRVYSVLVAALRQG
jgi:hypothetical protein